MRSCVLIKKAIKNRGEGYWLLTRHMERLSLLLFVSYSRWRGSSAFPVRVARNVVYYHWLSLLLGYRCVRSRVKLSWLFQLRLFNCAWRKCDNLSFTGKFTEGDESEGSCSYYWVPSLHLLFVNTVLEVWLKKFAGKTSRGWASSPELAIWVCSSL